MPRQVLRRDGKETASRQPSEQIGGRCCPRIPFPIVQNMILPHAYRQNRSILKGELIPGIRIPVLLCGESPRQHPRHFSGAHDFLLFRQELLLPVLRHQRRYQIRPSGQRLRQRNSLQKEKRQKRHGRRNDDGPDKSPRLPPSALLFFVAVIHSYLPLLRYNITGSITYEIPKINPVNRPRTPYRSSASAASFFRKAKPGEGGRAANSPYPSSWRSSRGAAIPAPP